MRGFGYDKTVLSEEGFKIKGSKNKKLVRIPSAIPIYAAAAMFLAWGLFSPIYKGLFILLAGACSIITFFAVRHFVPGRTELVEEEVFTGDQEIDQMITEGRESIRRFREAAQVVGDTRMKLALQRISDAGEAIIQETARDKTERTGVYTFFSYYLPTIDKLLSHYITFTGAGDGENIREGRMRIENSLDIIADAFEKQLDKMYKNEAMNVKTDIAVMETLLRSEGLIDTGDAEGAKQTQQVLQTSSGKDGIHV